MKTIREKILDLRKRKQSKYSIKQLVQYFGSDSHWAVIFIVNLPMAIPGPPYAAGFETLPSGLITLVLAVQILLGYKNIYLPEFIENKFIDISLLKKTEYLKVDNALKTVIEKYLKKKKLIFSIHTLKKYSPFLSFHTLYNDVFILTNWLPCIAITILSFVIYHNHYNIFLFIPNYVGL